MSSRLPGSRMKLPKVYASRGCWYVSVYVVVSLRMPGWAAARRALSAATAAAATRKRVIIRRSKVRPRWPAARPPALGRWAEAGYAAVLPGVDVCAKGAAAETTDWWLFRFSCFLFCFLFSAAGLIIVDS